MFNLRKNAFIKANIQNAIGGPQTGDLLQRQINDLQQYNATFEKLDVLLNQMIIQSSECIQYIDENISADDIFFKTLTNLESIYRCATDCGDLEMTDNIEQGLSKYSLLSPKYSNYLKRTVSQVKLKDLRTLTKNMLIYYITTKKIKETPEVLEATCYIEHMKRFINENKKIKQLLQQDIDFSSFSSIKLINEKIRLYKIQLENSPEYRENILASELIRQKNIDKYLKTK